MAVFMLRKKLKLNIFDSIYPTEFEKILWFFFINKEILSTFDKNAIIEALFAL